MDILQLHDIECLFGFQNIFLLRNSEVNTILVFPELNLEDLLKIVEYIYSGELTIAEENLDGFMFAAKILQIKGALIGTPFNPPLNNQNNEKKKDPKESKNTSSSEDSRSTSSSSTDSEEEIPDPVPASKIRKISQVDKEGSSHKTRKLPQKSSVKVKKVDSEKLSEKVKKVEPEETFLCSHCKKVYKGIRNTRQHERTCIKNPHRPMFNCKFCTRTFSRGYRLKLHENQHESNQVLDQVPKKIKAGDSHKA